MPRLPDKTAIQPRTDFSTPGVHIADTSAAFRGAASLGNALTKAGEEIAEADNTMDLLRADSEMNINLRKREREYDTDPDHKTYETRFGAESNQIVMDAGKGIRNPAMREKWLLKRGSVQQQAALDRVMTRGRGLAVEEKEVEIGNILERHQAAYAETTDPEQRRKILGDMEMVVRTGEATGLLRPKTVERLREQHIDATIGTDAQQRIFDGDAEGVLRDFGMVPGGKQKRRVAYGAPDLGSVSAKYESGGKGVGFISSGEDDPGGKSYGVHQLSSKDSMPAFLRSPEGKPYAAKFARQMVGSPTFNKTYSEIAAADPEGFAKAQFDFYARTHYQPAIEAAKAAGFDTGDRGVQEALFSISIQHGGARKIIDAASGAGDDAQSQIKALYRERSRYVAGLSSLSGRTKQAVLSRYKSEERDALRMAGTQSGVPSADRMADDDEDDGLGLIPWGEATEIEQDSPTRSQYRSLSGKKRAALIHQSRVALSAKTQADVKSDIARLENGEEELRDERGETAFDRAQRLLTPNQRERLAVERDQAILKRDAITPLKFMREDDVEAHIERIGQGSSSDRYGVVNKVKEKAWSEWGEIQEERRKDPAVSVSDHPSVRRAVEAANATNGGVGIAINEKGDLAIDMARVPPDRAQRVAQDVVQATLEAQASLGVPEVFRRTITKEQAKRLIVLPDVNLMSDRDLKAGLEKAAARAAIAYGPELGQRVFKDALVLGYREAVPRIRSMSGDRGADNIYARGAESELASEERFNLIAKKAFGQSITGRDMNRLSMLERLDSMPSVLPEPGSGMNPSQPYIGQPYQSPIRETKQPNERQTQLLLQQLSTNPAQAQKLREDFDAKFGEGAAMRIISKMMQGETDR